MNEDQCNSLPDKIVRNIIDITHIKKDRFGEREGKGNLLTCRVVFVPTSSFGFIEKPPY